MTPRRYGPLAYVPIHRRPPIIDGRLFLLVKASLQ
jgi:hypothetical protein